MTWYDTSLKDTNLAGMTLTLREAVVNQRTISSPSAVERRLNRTHPGMVQIRSTADIASCWSQDVLGEGLGFLGIHLVRHLGILVGWTSDRVQSDGSDSTLTSLSNVSDRLRSLIVCKSREVTQTLTSTFRDHSQVAMPWI